MATACPCVSTVVTVPDDAWLAWDVELEREVAAQLRLGMVNAASLLRRQAALRDALLTENALLVAGKRTAERRVLEENERLRRYVAATRVIARN
jgi:hypothetical protein